MSVSWRDDDEEFRVGGVRAGLKSKPRFSFTEVKLLLEAVKRNRYIILSECLCGRLRNVCVKPIRTITTRTLNVLRVFL